MCYPWIHEKLRNKEFSVEKISGKVSPANIVTKYINRNDIQDQLINNMGIIFTEGRARIVPKCKKEQMDVRQVSTLARHLYSYMNPFLRQASEPWRPEAVMSEGCKE